MARITALPAGPTPHEALVARGALPAPSTLEQRADWLDQLGWGRHFSWAQLRCLASYLQRYGLAPGLALFREGDHDAFLAIVCSGALEIRKHDFGEQARRVVQVGAGKMVGEMSILDGGARSATAVAAEPTDLLVLTRQDFHQLGRDHPALGLELTLAIATAIAQLLRQTTGTLVDHLQG